MPKRRNLDHLFLSIDPTSAPFTSPRAGGGRTRTKSQDRQAHGEHLRAQYLQALPEENDERELAFRFEFESEPGFDLHLKSLDPNAKNGVELLNVRVDGDVTKATVLVQRKRLGHFLKIFEEYLTKTRGKKQGPANRTLVDSIANVRRASVESLWTDPARPFPTSTEQIWWEVWLRRTKTAQEQFRAEVVRRELDVSKFALSFVDRVVLNLRASVTALSELLEEDELIAELRTPKISTAEFMQLTPKEQREWSDELSGRLSYAGENSPAVCLLDTGVTRGHPLIGDSLPSESCHTLEPAWGTDDTYGHGTHMAGLALFGDLGPVFSGNGPVQLVHWLESVKLIPRPGNTHNKETYGAVTREAIARAEIAAPTRTRVVCLTVTSDDSRERGRPSSWSAAIDDAAFGGEDGVRRFVCISSGDAKRNGFSKYPASNQKDSVHDPGQAWNALTIGAFADRDRIVEPDFKGWKCIAPLGGLCPSSTTSLEWNDMWPIKPEIVLPGGNIARDEFGNTDVPDSLCLLTTHHAPLARLLTTAGETSGATALAARLAARIHARYPSLWPETVRALMVHSAEWSDAMRDWLPRTRKGRPKRPKRSDVRRLLRVFGYGMPDEEAALYSASDALTLIKQSELQPYDKDGARLVTKDMHLYELPWPEEELRALGPVTVELRITLSYFVQPLPGERGYAQNQRHRYASHGLRFDVKAGTETPAQFASRINKAMRADGESATSKGDTQAWAFGADLRSGGSLHTDRWTGLAAELAAKNWVAVYPVVGWWRERPRFERWKSSVRYALVISIRTPGVDTDIYTPVAVKLGIPVPVSDS